MYNISFSVVQKNITLFCDVFLFYKNKQKKDNRNDPIIPKRIN